MGVAPLLQRVAAWRCHWHEGHAQGICSGFGQSTRHRDQAARVRSFQVHDEHGGQKAARKERWCRRVPRQLQRRRLSPENEGTIEESSPSEQRSEQGKKWKDIGAKRFG